MPALFGREGNAAIRTILSLPTWLDGTGLINPVQWVADNNNTRKLTQAPIQKIMNQVERREPDPSLRNKK